MNSTSEVSIHGPATARTATAAMILGTNDSVASWICVAAWKMLTTRPTASTVSSSGAETISSIQRLCWPRVKTCCGSIASGHEAGSERAEEQVPAVGEHEQHQLEGQRDEHRRQHHHAERHQDAGDDHVDDEKGQEDEKADLEGALQLARDECGNEHLEWHVGGLHRRVDLG